jgi:hypothetical protein
MQYPSFQTTMPLSTQREAPIIKGETRFLRYFNVPPQHPLLSVRTGDLFFYTPDSSLPRKQWYHTLIIAAQNYADFNTQGEMNIAVVVRLLIQWDPTRPRPPPNHHPQLLREYAGTVERSRSLQNADPYPWTLINLIIPRSHWDQDDENQDQTRFQKIWSSINRLVRRLLERRPERLGSVDHLDQTV